jgi:hypothetical protein
MPTRSVICTRGAAVRLSAPTATQPPPGKQTPNRPVTTTSKALEPLANASWSSILQLMASRLATTLAGAGAEEDSEKHDLNHLQQRAR